MSPSTHWADIDKAKKLLRQRTRMLFKALVLECYRRVVLRTPVASGRARGNWNLSIVSPSQEYNSEKFDKAGADSISRAMEFAKTLTGEDVAYIVNNLPYIAALENGHSQQAPQGMVAVTMAEVQMISAEMIRVITAESANIADMEAAANGQRS